MRAGVLILVLLGSVASPALNAQEPRADNSVSKRQVANCMSRRMAADRLLSFNEAAKVCKDQLKGRKSDTASNVAPKPVG